MQASGTEGRVLLAEEGASVRAVGEKPGGNWLD